MKRGLGQPAKKNKNKMKQSLFNKNYLLGIDMKTMLRHDHLPVVGQSYQGILTMTDDYSATFVEKACCQRAAKRNCRVYEGKHITMTYRPEDGHIRLNFREVSFTPWFKVDAFAIQVMEEIRTALAGFVENEPVA